MRLLIIGGGPGGYETALEAVECGFEVTLITEGPLGGTWDTTADDIIPGDYQLRLIVYDHANDVYPECMINITIVSES
ncbi:MAG TPA: FAD-dependent oxidoreductase [Bacteroidaceae bacterium]|nr:FAD-dependent oxidoreductase [Bacteroidaceae bacterium]